jgi:hypothetical protein
MSLMEETGDKQAAESKMCLATQRYRMGSNK